jgi:transcriptional regulator with XRE-family HTH domain
MAVRGQRQPLRTRLAASVRRLRSERSWTQERAAEAAGLNPRHYQKIEEGTVNTTLRTLEQLCRGFSVDVVELLKP